MKTNEKVKKNGMLKVIIPVILIITIVILAGFAYARYVTRINGQAQAQIASFNFDVTIGNSQSLNIDLASTRYANDTTKVARGQVAPDTKGAFNLNVDATGSNTSLIYNIDLDLSEAPENLKFYSDSNMKKEVMVQDNKIKIENFIGVNDTKTNTITLYWAWPYETGENDYEIGLNDIKDSRWMGQDIEIAVNAKGTQVLDRVTYLADEVEIGDYVNYDATSGDGEGLSITPTSDLTGSETTTTFNSSDIGSWRVYDVDNVTKTVTLIAEDSTESTLTLSGKQGYKNGLEALDLVGSIFGHGNGAYLARSIQEKDIVLHSNFNKMDYSNRLITNGYYYYTKNQPNTRVTTQEYTSGTFLMDDNSEMTASDLSPVTMKQTYYSYIGSSYINTPYSDLIFHKGDGTWQQLYWFADRSVYLFPDYCGFCIGYVATNQPFYYGLYYTNNSVNVPSYHVRPMVILDANIKTAGQDSNNIWQLDVE